MLCSAATGRTARRDHFPDGRPSLQNTDMPNARFVVLVLLAALAACSPDAPQSAPVDSARILAADKEPGNWLSHGRTYGEQRFSPLSAVSTANVSKLGLAWTYELRAPRGAEATPIVVDGVMYVTSAWSIVYALDAASGRELWVYDPKVNHRMGARACCDVVNRGVAIYGDKVFVGALDGRLIALNAKSGAVAWETQTTDTTRDYTSTGAPRVANGLVYIGNGGAEYGVRGYVSAYDVTNGALKWRFYTVPGDPAKGPDHAASDAVMGMAAKTWNGSWWKLGGGGTVWDAIVYDAEFDQLIVGVGNGSPWNQQLRSPGGGDNLFLSSILALDAKTGAYKWHYQTTPGESWDYTATQPIILADLTIGGVVRKVAMQAPKNGFFYVVDRTNGKLISAKPFIPMARTKDTPKGVPISWAYGMDSVTGRPLENPEARFVNAPVLLRPFGFGAHNWHPMSFSPATGLVYLPAQDIAGGYANDTPFAVREGFWNTGTAPIMWPDDPKVREAIKGSLTGTLLAWDPVAQKEVWRAARPGPWNGGTLATAGGLVFQGTVDGHFLAMDAMTGKQLWSFDNQAATLAGPVTYEARGEQYVSVLGGYGSAFFLIAGLVAPNEGSAINGRVYAFRIGGSAPMPSLALAKIPMPKPPEIAVTPADYGRAMASYGRYCAMCHGIAAISGSAIPDLRRSARLGDAAAWKRAVLDGELAAKGMPKAGAFVDAKEAELIRTYVSKQAAMAYAREQAPK